MTREELSEQIDQWLSEWGYGDDKILDVPLCDFLADKISTVYRDSVIDECINIGVGECDCPACDQIKIGLISMKTGGR